MPSGGHGVFSLYFLPWSGGKENEREQVRWAWSRGKQKERKFIWGGGEHERGVEVGKRAMLLSLSTMAIYGRWKKMEGRRRPKR
jgi:hypothetical protein